MRRLARAALVVLIVVVAGFVAERIFGPGADPMGEATEAIKGLPYSVEVREASEGVLVGSARGHHGAVVHFAISEGEGEPAGDIPPRLIHVDKNVMGGGGFTVWEDAEAWHHGESAVKWRERLEIAVEIEEALCRKETGDACPV
jgi:hypothetical protein